MRKDLYWKCPVCAKVSRPKKFVKGAENGHPFQVAIQEFIGRPRKIKDEDGKVIGGKGGFHWTKRPMNREELEEVKTILQAITGRLEDCLDFREDLESAQSREDFWKKADKYIAEAASAVDYAKAELDFRNNVVTKLAKHWDE